MKRRAAALIVPAMLAVLSTMAAACSESEPESRATDDPNVSPAPLPTVPITATTLPIPVATTAPPPTTATTAPATTAPLLVEDLADGDHVGFASAIENGTLSFDRVEPVDAEGDGVIESVTNDNPRLRAVPIPASVPLDGEPVDAATLAERLAGGNVLVRLTIEGQQLVAIERVTLGAPTAPGG